MAARGNSGGMPRSYPRNSSPPVYQQNRQHPMEVGSMGRNPMTMMNLQRPNSASPVSVSSVGSCGSYKKKGSNAKAEICVGEELKISIKIALDDFRYDDDKKELEFPSSLTATERAYIHRLCPELGLTSKSRGKSSNRYLTIFKKDCNKMPCSVATYQMTRNSRHQIHGLLQRFPVTNKERQELQQRTERGYHFSGENGQKEINRTTGRLNNGIPQIPLRKFDSEFELFRQSLPVHHIKDMIMTHINDNRVVLISGDTGSGKTTQIPQLILDNSFVTGRPCRVICTQPRRISALAMAERVAAERGEKIGQTVGYQIRLESRVSPKTVLTFCTNGVLLRTLMGGQNSLSTVTHVIVDEIHERDKYSDFLLIQLREILLKNHTLKLVLMSAALDTQLFQQYFAGCPLIEIPGGMYEVKELFLEDVLKCTGYTSKIMEKYKKELLTLEDHKNKLEEWCQQREVKISDTIGKEAVEADEQIDEGVDVDKDEDLQVVTTEKELDTSEMEPWLIKDLDRCIMDVWLKGSDEAFSQLFHLIHSENVSVDYKHSETGATALMVAAGRGNMDNVEKLLNLGANVKVMSSNDWTAKDWAKAFNRTEIVDLLEAHIAAIECSCTDESMLVSQSENINEEDKELLSIYHHSFDDEIVDLDLIVCLIHYICNASEEGAVLIFLPGYDEIVTLRDRLNCDEKQLSSNCVIFTMHSNMQTQDQKKVFRQPPRGFRKIILSTNLAETSVTINDVVFVIDSGKVKEKSFDALTNVSMLKNNWISKASATQRMGRAGRCRPGICFHLFSRVRYQSLLQFQMPELLRVPLQELCLHTKLLAPQNTTIADFLSKAPDPPSFLVVRNAVHILKSIDSIDPWEDLTELGLHLADLPVEPRLGKMVLYSVVLKCLDPVLTIVCALAYRDPFVLPNAPSQKRAAHLVRKKFAAATYSDHMALLRAFQAWQRARADGWERAFCEKNFLSQATMEMVVGMRTQLLGQLRASGFVRARGGGDIRDLNSNSENWAVVKAALCAGTYPNLIRVDRDRMQLMTQKESKVRLHQSSVLCQPPVGKATVADTNMQNVKNLPTDFLVFEEMTRSHRITHSRCVSLVSPVTVTLFAGPARLPNDALSLPDSAFHDHMMGPDGNPDSSSSDGDDEDENKKATLRIDEWLSFKIDPEAATYALQLRQKWHSLFLRRMRAPSKPWSQVDEAVIRAVIGVLTNEEQALGLQQPAGIGQRPRPMSSEPMSPNYGMRRPSFENEHFEADDSESSRKPWMRSPKRNNTTPPRDKRRDFRSPKSGDDRLQTFGKSPTTVNSPHHSPSPPATVKGQSMTDKTSPSNRYFIVKCNSMKNLETSLNKGIWSTTPTNEQKFNQAFKECENVYLVFSVQASGHFQGYATMSSEIGKEKSHEMGIGSSTPLGGIFKVKWIKRANVSFQQTSHLSNPWNENRKVKVARDGQELEPSIGDKLLQLWSKVEEYKHGSGDASSRTTPANSPPNHSPGPKGGKGKNSDKSKSPQFHTQTPPMTPQYPKSSPLLGTVPPFSPAHPQVYQTPTGSPIPLAHSSPSHYPGMVFQPRGASGDYFNAGAMSQLSLGNNAPMMHPNMYNQYGQKGGSPGNRGGIPGNRGGSPGNRGGSRRNGGQHRNKSYDKSDNKK